MEKYLTDSIKGDRRKAEVERIAGVSLIPARIRQELHIKDSINKVKDSLLQLKSKPVQHKNKTTYLLKKEIQVNSLFTFICNAALFVDERKQKSIIDIHKKIAT
jgi:hypothetical protein